MKLKKIQMIEKKQDSENQFQIIGVNENDVGRA